MPAATTAEQILAQLGEDFSLTSPDLSGDEYQVPDEEDNPLYADISTLEIDDLTTGVVDGTGSFDRMMASHKAHLREQYAAGLISGDQYTKAYIELTTAALNAALQFLLAKDQTRFSNLTLQLQARKAEVDVVTSRVQLEIAKFQLAQAETQTKLLEAQYVLTLMQVANEDVKYNLAERQIDLVNEQIEATRAQTLDQRTDGSDIVGSVGKQKELYDQQIDSYRKDAMQKVAKMYLDGWITQKTLDEGLIPPTQLTNNEINEVLSNIRAENNLGS